jgi:hypothetical protein
MPEGVRAPWWLKPANELYKVFLRRGVSLGREHTVVLTVPGRAGRLPVFRIDPIT